MKRKIHIAFNVYESISKCIGVEITDKSVLEINHGGYKINVIHRFISISNDCVQYTIDCNDFFRKGAQSVFYTGPSALFYPKNDCIRELIPDLFIKL